MTKTEAISALEDMPEDYFQEFFSALPARVKLMVKGGMVNWAETLAGWYIKKVEN